MPLALVIVVTLVEENIFKSMGETKNRVLFVDQDGEMVGKWVEESFRKSGSIEIVKDIEGKPVDIETAKKAVLRGDFQTCIHIPPGLTEAFKKTVRESVKNSLASDAKKRKTQTAGDTDLLVVPVYFDPTLRGNYRAGMINGLEKVILGLEIKEKMGVFSELLPEKMKEMAKKMAGPMWSDEYKKGIPKIQLDWDEKPLMAIKEKMTQSQEVIVVPNTIQQNVPAWTLFGMFFIVVPLGGSIIRERQELMLARLLTMPTSYLTIISGKILAYVMICLVQVVLIFSVGKFLLPLLGTPGLELGSSPAALILVVLSSALAASGYGILLGTIARTYEQASMFGAVSVVIAAALGGVMVPVFMMPQIMQKISLFSPLAWGLNALVNVLVRGGNIQSIIPDAALLMIFFVITVGMAWFYMFKQGRVGIQQK
jgi:ABC-2 type transport system permease protein